MTTHAIEPEASGGKKAPQKKHAPHDKPGDKAITVEVNDGIAIVRFDAPGEKQNTLSEATGKALGEALEKIENDPAVRAAVLISGKPDGFIAGADVGMLAACRTAGDVEALSRMMQAQLNRLEAGKKPVVAAIHGACMGGGLEVALACHYRIATEHPKTVLSVPEVMLGLLPGGGGTQRLPRLIGLQAALDMLLTGKNIRPYKAKKLGLVDAVTVPYGLEEAAVTAAKRLADGTLKPRVREKSPQDRVLEDTPAGRALVFHQARAQVMEKTAGLYPAPLAILDVVEAGLKKVME